MDGDSPAFSFNLALSLQPPCRVVKDLSQSIVVSCLQNISQIEQHIPKKARSRRMLLGQARDRLTSSTFHFAFAPGWRRGAEKVRGGRQDRPGGGRTTRGGGRTALRKQPPSGPGAAHSTRHGSPGRGGACAGPIRGAGRGQPWQHREHRGRRMQAKPGAQAARPFKLRKSFGRGGGCAEGLLGRGGLRARLTLLLSPAQPPVWKK